MPSYARQQDEIERLDSVLNGFPCRTWPAGPGVLERERQPQAMSQAEYREQSQRLRRYTQIKWVWFIFTCSPSSPTARPLT